MEEWKERDGKRIHREKGKEQVKKRENKRVEVKHVDGKRT